MKHIEYIIDKNPSTSDDKIIRDGIVNFNCQIINEQATHFSVFAKNGFYCIGTIPEYLLGHDRIFMRKDLS